MKALALPSSAALAAILMAATPARADTPYLSAWSSAGGAYTGTTPWQTAHDTESQSDMNANASELFSVKSVEGYTNGSLAHASATSQFGTLHAEADAYFPQDYAEGYIEGIGETAFTDYLKPSASISGTYTNYSYHVAIDGTHSVPSLADSGGYVADATFTMIISAADGSASYALAQWSSSDTSFGTVLSGTISVAPSEANQLLSIAVYFEADAYVSGSNVAGHQYAMSDYSDTVQIDLDALTSGANTVGLSGHDYATIAAVPEPGAAPLMAVGLVAIGLAKVRRSRRA